MIVAAWLRWKEAGHLCWLVLAAGLLILDLIIGPALIAWEIGLLREMMK